MLVLSRRLGEVVYIDDNIQISICSVRGEVVRLGIQAPPEVKVNRKEIYDRIKLEERDMKND